MNYPYITEILVINNDGVIIKSRTIEVNDVADVVKVNNALIEISNYCTGRDDLNFHVWYRRMPILFVDGFQVYYSEEELKLKLAANVSK